jgi:hypothetical protein
MSNGVNGFRCWTNSFETDGQGWRVPKVLSGCCGVMTENCD